ncbi:hypothetical protein BC936DRAFT_145500 [Jimgerdemannia flammicorona]|uniref:Attractin/MKLN-like beta-propeller domain-containing protein n=1 Tax=Jimgerdemannia flammicorona TaxID=994334 RepID=A0A433DLY7_9FUNG|nr:hypothetical protein BC936DRAFT_145500 [Jimgerdemannia flammicorona]
MIRCNHPFLSSLFLLLILAISTVCLIPPGRDSAGIALLNNTIWVFGGAVSDNNGGYNPSSSLYSLDISQSWSTSSPNWIGHDADINSTIVSGRIRPNMQVGPDGTSLWVYGGQPTNATSANLFLCYDTTTHTWSTVAFAGAIRLQGFNAVKNARGVIFFFGGVTDETSLDAWARNDAVFKIDPTMKTWSTTSVANGYPGRVMATATLVSDTKVYIIGGAVQTPTTGVLVSINNVTVYDTVAGTWSWSMTTGSQLPLNRSGHAAELSYDGKSIIIFGGNGGSAVGYFSDVWTLDVNLFQWTSPTVTGSGPKTGIYGMNSLLIGYQMLIMFGTTLCYFIKPSTDVKIYPCINHLLIYVLAPPLGSGLATSTYYNDVYVLDTKNWAWTTAFAAVSVQTEAPTQTGIVAPTTGVSAVGTNGTSGSNGGTGDKGGIGGIGGIGGLVGIICGLLSLIGIISFITWTVRRNRRADAAVKANENPELSTMLKPNENAEVAELPTKDPPPPITPNTAVARGNVVDPHTTATAPSTVNPSDPHLPQSSMIPSDAIIFQTGPAVIGAYSAPHQPYYYPVPHVQPNANPVLPASMYYYPGTPQFQPGFYYPPPLPPPHGTILQDNSHTPGDGTYVVGGRYPPPNSYTPSLHHVDIPAPPMYSAQSAEAPQVVLPRPHQRMEETVELQEERPATRGDA